MVIFGPIDQFGCSQRLFRRRRLDRLQRPGTERAARRGQDDALDVFARTGAERLEYGIVLAIDRQHGGAGDGRAPHEQAASTNETFLVGEGDGGTAFDRSQRGLQSDRAADRRHQPVGRTLRGFEQTVLARCRFDPAAGQGVLQIIVSRRIGHHGQSRVHFAGDFCERSRAAPGANRLDAITVRRALDQIDRAGADRAGSAENGDAAHFRCGRRF